MFELRISIPANMGQELEQASRRAHEEFRKVLEAGAKSIERTAKKKIQGVPKSGRLYRRGRVLHQASAPGQPPATDSGFLVGSFFSGLKDQGLTVEVGVTVFYGGFLELGTSKMKPRPYLKPSAEERLKDIADGIDQAIRSYLV
jgi:HK97 gp10 family phage protein